MRLKGIKRSDKIKGAGWTMALSGVGTTRGAGWTPSRCVGKDVRGMLSRSVSVLRVFCGAACAASAPGSIVSPSPSKKRVMAIWVFHWHLCRSGRAVSRSWSVTDVNCCSAVCCSAVRLAMSTDGVAMLAVASVHPSCLIWRWVYLRRCLYYCPAGWSRGLNSNKFRDLTR